MNRFMQVINSHTPVSELITLADVWVGDPKSLDLHLEDRSGVSLNHGSIGWHTFRHAGRAAAKARGSSALA
jgi:hypothetical protein